MFVERVARKKQMVIIDTLPWNGLINGSLWIQKERERKREERRWRENERKEKT